MWLSLLHVLHVFVCMDPTSGSHPLPWHRSSLKLSVRVPLVEVFAPSNEMPPWTISAPLPSPSCWRRHLQTLSQERIGQWWVLCFTVSANTAGSSRFQMCWTLSIAPACQCFHSHGGFGVGCRWPAHTCPGVKAHLLAPLCSWSCCLGSQQTFWPCCICYHPKELDYLITSGDFCLMLPWLDRTLKRQI